MTPEQENRWIVAEPDLAEVLAEPTVHLLMQRDGVTPCGLRRVLVAARSSLRKSLCPDLAA